MKIEKWIEKNCKSLEGQTVLVTGSTGVLGVELCKVLAKLGANLIFANRNEKLTAQQIEELKKDFSGIKIDFVKIDMLDVDSVKSACKTLQSFSIDKVILNAGAYKMDREKTSLGLDKVFK